MKRGHAIAWQRADRVLADPRAALAAAREVAVKEAVLAGARLTGTWSMMTIDSLTPTMVLYIFDVGEVVDEK